MFHYDRGIKITRGDLALDFQRRQPRGFISHAHADHMARHELALATPETGRLYQHRMSPRNGPMVHRRVLELSYRKPVEFGPLRLTTYPAGHCLGSAMLLVEDRDESLLYTGDFKLGPSATAEEAELPYADTLIMESTFGRPRYTMPPRKETVAQLVELVKETIAAGRSPVIHAYAFGKSQEVTKLLTLAGIRVLQHPQIFAISEIYKELGVDLGDVACYPKTLNDKNSTVAGCAVITLPPRMKSFRLAGLIEPVTFAVTGWAVDESTKYRWNVDHALPLSDHADFAELIETVERVAPKKVFCTHGPDEAEFAAHLRDRGFDAEPLVPPKQKRLF